MQTYEDVREMTGKAVKSHSGLVVSIIDPRTGAPYPSDADGNIVLKPGSSKSVTIYSAEIAVRIMNNTAQRYDVTLELSVTSRETGIEPMRIPAVGIGDNTWEINADSIGREKLVSSLNSGWDRTQQRLMNEFARTVDRTGLIVVRIVPEFRDTSFAASLSSRQSTPRAEDYAAMILDENREIDFVFKTFSAPLARAKMVKPLARPNARKPGVTVV